MNPVRRRRHGFVALGILVAGPSLVSGAMLQYSSGVVTWRARIESQATLDAAWSAGQELSIGMNFLAMAWRSAQLDQAELGGQVGLAAAAASVPWGGGGAQHLAHVVDLNAGLLRTAGDQLSWLTRGKTRLRGLLDDVAVGVPGGQVSLSPADAQVDWFQGLKACVEVFDQDPWLGLVPGLGVEVTGAGLATRYSPTGPAAYGVAFAAWRTRCVSGGALPGLSLAKPRDKSQHLVEVRGAGGRRYAVVQLEAVQGQGTPTFRPRLISAVGTDLTAPIPLSLVP